MNVFSGFPMKQKTIAELDKKRGLSLLGLQSGNLQLSRLVLVDIVAMIDMTLVILDAFLIKGPVLFRQRRHGLNHKVIEVLKFRTMSVLEDGESIRQATKNDSRVTRVAFCDGQALMSFLNSSTCWRETCLLWGRGRMRWLTTTITLKCSRTTPVVTV